MKYAALFVVILLSGIGTNLAQDTSGKNLQLKTLRFIANNIESLQDIKVFKEFSGNKNHNIFYTLENARTDVNSFHISVQDMDKLVANDSMIAVEDTINKKMKVFPVSKPEKRKMDLLITLYDTTTKYGYYFVGALIESYYNYHRCHLLCEYDSRGNLMGYFYREYNNTIGDLKSDKDVEAFMQEYVNPRFRILSQEDLDQPGRHMKHAWTRQDISTDNATDLVVAGNYQGVEYMDVVIDNGKEYKVFWLGGDGQTFVDLPSTENIRNNKALLLTGFTTDKAGNTAEKTDTLVYKQGAITEYNPHPAATSIQKIEYVANGCKDGCPEFSMTINSNYQATYNPRKNNPKIGSDSATTTVNGMIYLQIAGLLNYMDFTRLDDTYGTPADSNERPTAILTITYDNGKVKRIQIYGDVCPYGLSAVFDKISELRYTEEWR